jgi:hypothetical protein
VASAIPLTDISGGAFKQRHPMKIWRNLFWKEWHEQKWKLLALTSIAVSVCVALLFQDLGNVAFALIFTNFAYAMLAPILMGMGVCAGEHASGVIQFVRAQPIAILRVATVRWIAGACVLLIPLVAASVICWIVGRFEDQVGPQSVRTGAFFQVDSTWRESSAIYLVSLAGMAACLNLYAWVVAFAVNQRTEFRAGLIGLMVTVALIFAGIGGLSAWDNHLPDISVLGVVSVISSPLFWLGIVDFIRHSQQGLVVVAVAWQLLLTICLMQVMVFRYGREERWLSEDFFKRTKTVDRDACQLGKPRSSQWRALLWLQIRQSVPVCVVGLTVVVGTALAIFTSDKIDPDAFDGIYPIGGCILALLIGVGTFVSELQPGLHTFWRSRPISPASWFWFKFIGGAIALIGLFDVPCLLLSWFSIVRTSSPGFKSIFPILLHLPCYSIAVFFACTVRHSTYATVLAVGVILAGIMVPELSDVHLPEYLSFLMLWRKADNGYSNLLPAFFMVSVFVIPITVATAYLVKRDFSIGS